jgi:hypothetical protein
LDLHRWSSDRCDNASEEKITVILQYILNEILLVEDRFDYFWERNRDRFINRISQDHNAFTDDAYLHTTAIDWQKLKLLRYSKRLTTRARIATVRTEFQDHLKQGVRARLQQVDPTGKYWMWILTKYLSGGIRRWEDVEFRVHDALETFNTLKTRGDLRRFNHSSDVNDYDTLADLDRLHNMMYAQMTNQARDRDTKDDADNLLAKDEIEKMEDDEWTVIMPKTKLAAAYWGSHSWCTSWPQSNYFERYTSQGPLYILVPKNRAYDKEKYQIHVASNQLMDETDTPVSRTELLFPQMKTVLSQTVLASKSKSPRDTLLFQKIVTLSRGT